MTNKNDSANPVRIRIDQKKLDLANLTTRPALYEVGTLDDGVIIIRSVNRPTKACSLPATERRSD